MKFTKEQVLMIVKKKSPSTFLFGYFASPKGCLLLKFVFLIKLEKNLLKINKNQNFKCVDYF